MHLPLTRGGHDPRTLISMMQKAIRRARPDLAGWAALELLGSGYGEWAWRRITITAAEDCASCVMPQILALRDACERERRARRDRPPTRVFLARAILILCRAWKCRDADALGVLVIDGGAISDSDLAEMLEAAEAEPEPIPEWVFDVHTLAGKRQGKTKSQFMREERAALTPVHPALTGLFDHLIE
jgi:hypothetical protein